MTEFERRQREYTLDELFRLAVEAQRQDRDEYWEYYDALISAASREAFEVIRGYAYFAPVEQRAFAAHLLGAFGIPRGRYHDECVALLIELTVDPDPAVVAQAVRSLGMRGDMRSIEWLVDLRDYPDERVRLALAIAFGGCPDDRAIDVLVELTEDWSDEVRAWATYGLAELVAADTPEIRRALTALLLDHDLDVRGEALVGLALRGDDLVYTYIRIELLGEFRGVLPVRAAQYLGAADLAPLIAAQRSWLADDLLEAYGAYYDTALASLRLALLYERGLRVRIQAERN